MTNEQILLRMRHLNAMYERICETADDLIAWFLTYFPDEPSIMDLYDIAIDDEQYKAMKDLYSAIMDRWYTFDW